MKKRLIIFSLLISSALLFAQCKTCGCGYQPKKAKSGSVWYKK